MLCMRCLRRLVPAREPCSRPSVPRRNLTSTRSIRSESHLDPLARAPSTTPAFSTPFTNPPSEPIPSDVKPPEPKSTLSKAKAGTVLKGLGYLKDRDQPIAGEDSDYPDWLWGLLDTKEGEKGEGGAEGDIFSKSKKERRKAAHAARKAALDPSSRIPKIPYEHQTIDLPVAESQYGRAQWDPTEGERGWEKAQRAREDLTQAMRDERRKAIKESNFLKSMK